MMKPPGPPAEKQERTGTGEKKTAKRSRWQNAKSLWEHRLRGRKVDNEAKTKPVGSNPPRSASALAASDDPHVTLRKATATEFGEYARRVRHNEMWWYFNGLAPYRRFSRPFVDADRRWWFCVKPGFAWPISFFEPVTKPPQRLPKRFLLGWQFPVESTQADSVVTMNVIHDLGNYSIATVAENKRRAVRKGLRELQLEVVHPRDPKVCTWACAVWNSHVERTGWNRKFPVAQFSRSWAELADWPGTTVLAAWPKGDPTHFCGWLIARVIDDTVYIDTIASHTDCLPGRPNDALIFTCLSAARAHGVRHAHYSLKSDVTSLEEFKASLGFEPFPFPARLHLRPGVATMVRLLRPAAYRRLLGER
jgi:hypothetical protein